jgi:hypothetical protein
VCQNQRHGFVGGGRWPRLTTAEALTSDDDGGGKKGGSSERTDVMEGNRTFYQHNQTPIQLPRQRDGQPYQHINVFFPQSHSTSTSRASSLLCCGTDLMTLSMCAVNPL